VFEVQRQWWLEFETEPPTLFTIARIRDKFVADGREHDGHKQRSGRQQVLPLLLRCCNSLHNYHSSPQNNRHMKLELANQVYNAF
jgi:hypothetical protein